jgi:cyclopropane fatty-acyl-phospholipid synthase-like methyltransferase
MEAAVATRHFPAVEVAHPTVVMCYRLLDLSLLGGIHDFTDGIYDGGPARSRADYLAAQQRQSEYLLDEIGCGRGSRILDIGCGNGRLLRQAEQRGAQAVGITISEEQVARCRRQGLQVNLLNYRGLPPNWDGTFDGLVANGSLEHFVSIEDAMAGQDDQRYAEMFSICRGLVSIGSRLATTAIHFREPGQVRPEDMQRGPYAFASGSPEYQFAMVLERTFGGWYPTPGQLESCAHGCFRLVREVDGTRDYHLTSEYWLRRMKWSLAANPRVWAGLAHKLAKYPRPTIDMLRCLVTDQSWNWQFRGDPAPTFLLRHTWEAI